MSAEPVRVLAVDDVPENLAALDALLADRDIELLKARSGIEALELLLVNDVALALLDVQMPGMDGFELAELMRGTERTRSIPIIFLTAVATDERRKFRGYEAGAVDYLFKPVDPSVVRSKVDVFTELYRQRRELAEQRDELARQRDELASAVERITAHGDNSPLAIVEIDRDQRIVSWSKGAERVFGWRSAEVAGFLASEVKWLSPDNAGDFARLMQAMITGGSEREICTLMLCTAEGYTLECECYCSALHDRGGHLVSVTLQILDVTERRRAEETQKLLVGELNHRVKNTLATVQAISQQTLRYSSGPSDFTGTFLGRIHSLADAHSILSSATWKGANLRELIAGQIAIGAFAPERVIISGPDVELGAEPALHLALVLHELVTNAHKYGALSSAEGTVSLSWRVVEDILHLDWIERGAPAVTEPSRKGFGTALIERSLRADGGTAAATYDAEGIVWKFTLPCLARRSPAPRSPASAAPAASAPSAEAGHAAERQISLAGKRFLIIEDEPLLALELAALIEDAGGIVAGAASEVAAALAMIEDAQADAALLDGNLQGHAVDAVADALAARRIPFLFVSGYGRDHLPAGHPDAPLVGKPFDTPHVLAAARSLLGEPQAAS